MSAAMQFVGTHPIVVHNAAYDSKFWEAELRPIDGRRKQEFSCSMLLARRIFLEAPNWALLFGRWACLQQVFTIAHWPMVTTCSCTSSKNSGDTFTFQQ